MNNMKRNIFNVINKNLKSFFFIILMKIQAFVVSCDEFLYACIVEICCQSTESAFNHLHCYPYCMLPRN
jgi:hypothetical protein